MFRKIVLMSALIIFFMSLAGPVFAATENQQTVPWWKFQSIDTMKYSRDNSREYLGSSSTVKAVIKWQVAAIAETGVTHVAIATPYDEEFLPILRLWVAEARKHELKVWFRGNWSGWEQWFEYPRISREQHIEKTILFIEENPDLFEDGDFFTACPECENGGPGDPRRNNDAVGHRKFLIQETEVTTTAFQKIKKEVHSNLHPMNADVARLVMDEATTKALGGIVTIDHYVKTPEQLAKDVRDIAKKSKGKIILGEFGAPIPDINGKFTDAQQAEWIQNALTLLVDEPDLIGLSYWTNVGGTTEIWSDDGQASSAVEVLTSFFKPQLFEGTIKNELGHPILEAIVQTERKSVVTDKKGTFRIPYLDETTKVTISASGYDTTQITIAEYLQQESFELILINQKKSFLFRLRLFINSFFN